MKRGETKLNGGNEAKSQNLANAPKPDTITALGLSATCAIF